MSQPQEASTGHLTFREQVHQMLRESVLDAAFNRASEADWDDVRISDIAKDVGVSRQTIYNEFGTKEQLSQVLFNREMEQFLAQVVEVSRKATSLEGALRDSLTWLFETSATHPMLQRLIADARAGKATSLLPLLTTNAHVVIRPMRAILAQVYHERWEGDLEQVEQLTDLVVRLGISHVLSESDYSVEQVVDMIVKIVHATIIGSHDAVGH